MRTRETGYGLPAFSFLAAKVYLGEVCKTEKRVFHLFQCFSLLFVEKSLSLWAKKMFAS